MKPKKKTFHLTADQCKEIEKRAKQRKVTESSLIRGHFKKILELIDTTQND